jgi:hypothetical protein
MEKLLMETLHRRCSHSETCPCGSSFGSALTTARWDTRWRSPTSTLPSNVTFLCLLAQVVDYWNSVDEDLELDMDVLDDIVGEVKQARLPD